MNLNLYFGIWVGQICGYRFRGFSVKFPLFFFNFPALLVRTFPPFLKIFNPTFFFVFCNYYICDFFLYFFSSIFSRIMKACQIHRLGQTINIISFHLNCIGIALNLFRLAFSLRSIWQELLSLNDQGYMKSVSEGNG